MRDILLGSFLPAFYQPGLHDHGICHCPDPFYSHPYEPAFLRGWLHHHLWKADEYFWCYWTGCFYSNRYWYCCNGWIRELSFSLCFLRSSYRRRRRAFKGYYGKADSLYPEKTCFMPVLPLQGGMCYSFLLSSPVNNDAAMIISAVLVVAIRLLATHYCWNLPRALKKSWYHFGQLFYNKIPKEH